MKENQEMGTPDYKNWMPKGMITAMVIATVVFFALSLILLVFPGEKSIVRIIFIIIFLIVFAALLVFTIWFSLLYRAFDYHGPIGLSKRIIEGTASYVKIPDRGTGLDIGCGSGALSIASAKRNPNAKITGCDRWGAEYYSFSKELCKNNAAAEGVSNVAFQNGDATALPFKDETFDCVFSNYVYHNIPSKDRQEILLETLRVLKKGGTFAIHDLFTKSKYGDMDAFCKKLKSMGYEKVEFIDTTDGLFMNRKEAKNYMLTGSKLLVGKK